MMPLLRIEALRVAYGQIEALKGISLALMPGEITALVGANGAGKSTTLLAISGLIAAQAGRILLEESDLRTLAPHHIVRRGVVQVA
ncbi:ATP-binding cassette domain-containing protein, partial [Pseudomonas sp. AB12(2023)]